MDGSKPRNLETSKVGLPLSRGGCMCLYIYIYFFVLKFSKKNIYIRLTVVCPGYLVNPDLRTFEPSNLFEPSIPQPLETTLETTLETSLETILETTPTTVDRGDSARSLHNMLSLPARGSVVVTWSTANLLSASIILRVSGGCD